MNAALLFCAIAAILWKLRVRPFEGTLVAFLLAPILSFLSAFVIGRTAPWGAMSWLFLAAAVAIVAFVGRRDHEEPKERLFEALALFAVPFLGFYILVLQWPDFVAIGERLRDYALLSSVQASPVVALEPWMRGSVLNYYLYWYRFGHLLGQLFEWPVWQIYHALQAFSFTLFFGVLYLLLRRALRLNAAGAAGAALLVTVGSNVAGAWSFLSNVFAGFKIPLLAVTLQPDDNWWGPSRVIKGAINEFPAWSFLLGDLHPHFVNLLFLPLVLLMAHELATSRESLRGRVVYGVGIAMVGALFVFNANAWELPLYATLACAIAGAWGARAALSRWVYDASGSAERAMAASGAAKLAAFAGTVLLSVASLYLSSRNIQPADAPARFVKAPVEASTMTEFMSHWGLPLTLTACSLVVLLQSTSLRIFAGLLLLAGVFLDEARYFILALFVGFGLYLFERIRARERFDDRDLAFYVATVVGLTAVTFPELMYFDDPYGGENERMNTIFKFYSAGWSFVYLSSFYFATLAASKLRLSKRVGGAVLAGVVVVFCGFLVRTITLRRSPPPDIAPAAEGLSSANREFPGVAATIKQLEALPRGTVLEAQGPPYSYTSLVSTLSGNVSFLGWRNHVDLLTREYGETARREDVTKQIYTTEDCAQKAALVRNEAIDYVVLGPLEQKAYPAASETSFRCMRQVAGEGSFKVFAP